MSKDSLSEIVLTAHFNFDNYIVPAAVKVKDTRGFIYVVEDSKYPELIKVGKTIDFVKRVKTYNVDRPYEDVTPLLCTRLIDNVDLVEKHIKNKLSREFGSVGKSLEWFKLEALTPIYEILENEFDINYVCFQSEDDV